MGFEAALELGSSKMEAINWRREREKLRRWKEEKGWSTANCRVINSRKKFYMKKSSLITIHKIVISTYLKRGNLSFRVLTTTFLVQLEHGIRTVSDSDE